MYNVEFCQDTILLNTKKNGIFICNKIKLKDKTQIWSNYNLCCDKI